MDVASLVVDIQDYNDNIELRGVFLTKSEKNKACKETLRQLEEALGSLVFDTTIRKSATVSAATFEGKRCWIMPGQTLWWMTIGPGARVF